MASYISPAVRDKFETLSTELQQDILERNVKLNTVYDLMDVLKTIAQEED
ncbi:MAG: molecular chaperone GroEL [Lachnospiraceae bacterium]|nr:molecular chaperone GroEL [Lachnospiraceae bacterium]